MTLAGRLSRTYGGSAWALVLMLGVALVLRLGALAHTPDYRPVRDSIEYDQRARSIAAGDGFGNFSWVPGGGPSAFRLPAFPYTLGAVYAVTGNSITAGRVYLVLLGTL